MTITLSARFDILQRDGFTCQFCGRRAPETELEVDHLHPRSDGGSDDSKNLVTACRDCNRGKGTRLVSLQAGTWHTLTGKWFHTIGEDGYVDRQGTIIGALGEGLYVAQWFSWLDGRPTSRTLVKLVDMVTGEWVFYASSDAMNGAYEAQDGVRRRPSGACSAASHDASPFQLLSARELVP